MPPSRPVIIAGVIIAGVIIAGVIITGVIVPIHHIDHASEKPRLTI
jgi:hypothetical protein